MVYATFDDGPSTYTPQILAVLKANGVHATFFVIGRQIAAYSGYVRDEAAAGDGVGDHTWTHPQLTTLTSAQQQRELLMTSNAIAGTIGRPPDVWRAPYGDRTPSDDRIAKAMGMSECRWTIDPTDWARPGVGTIVKSVLNGARPGAIILEHDGGGDRSETVAAAKQWIPALKQRGYVFGVLVAEPSASAPPSASPSTVTSPQTTGSGGLG